MHRQLAVLEAALIPTLTPEEQANRIYSDESFPFATDRFFSLEFCTEVLFHRSRYV